MHKGETGDEMAMAILDSLAAHAAVLDADATVVAANRAWVSFAEEHPDDPWRPAVGQSYLEACEQAARTGSEQATAVADAVRSVLSARQRRFHVDYRWSVDGEDRWFSFRVAALNVPGGGAVVSHTEITSRKRAEIQLAHQALHDPLTGLPNRTLFLDRLSVALARMERSPDTVAVLFIDLDKFKVVNDSLGHDVGDQLLVAVANRLRAALRPGDTAARFGGDEFTVLCEGITSETDAVVIAERISGAVRRPFTLEDVETCLTSSIGIAIAAGNIDRPESLIRDADTAMYRAKQRGKARYELFSGVLRQRAIERLEIENALHRALDRDEFCLHFHPELDLRTGAIRSAEALVRWNHPELGLLLPSEWLAVSEEIGLVVPIGSWVMRRACQQAARWQQELGHEGLRVTVNLSARELAHPALVETTLKAAAEASVDPAQLGVEINQATLALDPETNAATLQRLRSAGLSVTVDDFGTGAASLGLADLPVDEVKIDRSSISMAVDAQQATRIVGALVELGHALDVRVVGKGVETAEQLDQFRAKGCDGAQGFHVGRPQDPAGL